MDNKSYQKYKCKVKIWETNFKKTYGRIPSKHDIHEANHDIREAYKMYFKLKSALLEETLMDIDIDDICSTNSSDSIQETQSHDFIQTDQYDISPTTKEQICLEETQSQETFIQDRDSDLEKKGTSWNVDQKEERNTFDVWGAHLSNKIKKTTKPEPEPKQNNTAVKYSQKLFKNSSFSKRNPRKSLSSQSLSKSDLGSEVSFSQPDSQNSMTDALPDLDQLLQTQAISQNVDMENNPNILQITNTLKPLRSIDPGWLERCDVLNSFETKKHFETDSGFNSLETSTFDVGSCAVKPDLRERQSFGLRNIDLTILKPIPVRTTQDYISESEDIIGNSESEDDSTAIKHIVKRRKIDSESVSSLSVFEPRENNISLNTKISNPTKFTTSEKFSNIEEMPFKDCIASGKETKITWKRIKDISDAGSSQYQSIENRIDNTRPSRSRKTIATYKEINENEEVNEDPYAFTDSEMDPDFEPLTDIKRSIPQEENEFEQIEIKKTRNKRKRATSKKVTENKPLKITKPRNTKSGVNNFHKSLQRQARGKTGIENKEVSVEKPREEEYELEFSLNVNTPNVSRLGVRLDNEEVGEKADLVQEFASAIDAAAAGDLVARPAAPAFDESKLLHTRKTAEKMNENFVRIDMKKKVYVRGKKPMNYSKYKKARWKERKAAALAGPDMDMGGCDGGLLKCFRCGHVGHFTKQCKAKIGDKLLPLEDDIEISPYPSLEEASVMANNSVLLAHASRPHTIPQASNLPSIELSPDKNKDPSEIKSLSDKTNSIDLPRERKAEEIQIGDRASSKESNKENSPIAKTDSGITTWKRHLIPEAFRKEMMSKDVAGKNETEPLYQLNTDGSLIKTPSEVYSILEMFGHKSFRPGQEKAIMRILSGQSTLVTLSTGSGKSLCYQLPAYLYAQTRNCITLVISPLVSLMEDQVTGVPDFLHATCLHTNQTPAQREKILTAIQSGLVNILLVSPEAVVSGEKRSGFGALLRSLPPIAFACIDEAHCVSQWSHNFRPSYLMICQVLREKLGVKTVLGLTATATRQTRESIIRHLEVPDGLNGIISDIPLPNNLNLSVSKDANRDRALIELLKSERFAKLQSIIVYCTRRQECERIAGFIRTCLQDNKPPEERRKRKSVTWNAEPYHAGMAPSRRRTIQNAFMRGDLRIVVATVAFGMGINKSDIRAIIHYNMPRTFENYVQEVGRAGRDGLEAHCHLFLDSKGEDRNELKRHIYADSIDRHVIRKLLQRVFLPCKCAENSTEIVTTDPSDANKISTNHQNELEALQQLNWSDMSIEGQESSASDNKLHEKAVRKRICPGHEVAFSVADTVHALDIPEENISTLLCYLELHQNNYVHVLSSAYTMCQITSYGGPKQLRSAAQNCPPLAMAIALDLKQGVNHDRTCVLEFRVIDIAAAIGWDSGVVKYQLKQLEWITVNGNSKRSTLNVEFSNLGFRVRSPGDLTNDELDETLDMLYDRTSRQEHTALLQLEAVFRAMTSVAFNNNEECSNLNLVRKSSDELKIVIREYFQRENDDTPLFNAMDETAAEGQIIIDVRSMIGNYPDNNFTGRALARIFYGISSPNYPAVIWGKCRYWRAHLKEDFHQLITIANREIIRMK